ncbi:unnamed protein product [Trichobilharzia szidati]|nr:unnamed protein product [Trichobilharzia szidati]
MNSIWLLVHPSGDTHVALWISLCLYTLPPITSSLKAQKSAKSSPFSFTSPRASLPMMSSLPVLSGPSLASMSPISILMSPAGVLSVVVRRILLFLFEVCAVCGCI